VSGAVRKCFTIALPAAVVATVVIGAGVEVWVRSHWNYKNGRPGLFLSDAVRGQRLAPNYDGWFAGVPVRTNNLGFRDPRDYSVAKSANTFRIVVLGDSVTFGHGSIYEHTYPYLVEQKLRAWRPDIDWQVWNVAVPGYNTSQELDQLEELGPVFKPDLVVVGFYENDLVDNRPSQHPGVVRRAAARLLSFAQLHVYSIELYKRIYLQLAWRFSKSDKFRERLEAVSAQEKEYRQRDTLVDADRQKFTPFDRVGEEDVRTGCRQQPTPNMDLVNATRQHDGFQAWVDAIRGFQALDREGKFRVVLFLNVSPRPCPATDDLFYDDGEYGLNALFLNVIGTGTPVVSTYDALLRTRPREMPGWNGHSFGNTNLVKSEVLFEYLRDRVLPEALLRRTRTSAAGR
jgi:hypothetical protein